MQWSVISNVFVLHFLFSTDINECEDGTDSCDENADCTNTDGSYTCACSSGFSGDGLSCDGKISSQGVLCRAIPRT